MKLIFMGTPEFAVPTLQALIDSEHEVVAVYTQPPRPAGRGHKLRDTPIHQLATQNNIPVLTPTSLKTLDIQAEFHAWQADAAIVSAYGLLLPPTILEACPHGCINVHPSKLPRWRGAAPIARPIIAGDTDTAICIMQMDVGLDSGDILLQKDYPITGGITAGHLHDLLAEQSPALVLDTLKMIEDNSLVPRKQPTEGTYAKKLQKNEGHIDFSKTAEKIDCLIRGVTPFPAAYFMLDREKFKVIEARCTAKTDNQQTGVTLDDKLTISCSDGVIQPIIIQRQGKKPMKTEELLRGFKINVGTRLL